VIRCDDGLDILGVGVLIDFEKGDPDLGHSDEVKALRGDSCSLERDSALRHRSAILVCFVWLSRQSLDLRRASALNVLGVSCDLDVDFRSIIDQTAILEIRRSGTSSWKARGA
jgi:hypothetical protein